MLNNRLEHVFKDGPAIVNVQVDLSRENSRIHIDSSDESVTGSRFWLIPLHKGEFHLVNSTQNRLHCPSRKFEGIVGDFLRQLCRLERQILIPRLPLRIPLQKRIQVGPLASLRVLEVRSASNAYRCVCRDEEHFVAVAEAEHLLVSGLLEGIIALLLSERVWFLSCKE